VHEKVLSLHKYYIRANRMRSDFDEFFAAGKTSEEIVENLDAMNYLLLWYGCLYVVIEGCVHLGLKDDEVEGLLSSDNVSLLKGVRHDTFHYQNSYDPPRTVKLLCKPDVVEWIRKLNRELGRFFHSWIEGQKEKDKGNS
jgi:hypothetical protein